MVETLRRVWACSLASWTAVDCIPFIAVANAPSSPPLRPRSARCAVGGCPCWTASTMPALGLGARADEISWRTGWMIERATTALHDDDDQRDRGEGGQQLPGPAGHQVVGEVLDQADLFLGEGNHPIDRGTVLLEHRRDLAADHRLRRGGVAPLDRGEELRRHGIEETIRGRVHA
ncbi:MAG: hypothetical protein R2705_11940 [Ilumatobacteraceae bacterium]